VEQLEGDDLPALLVAGLPDHAHATAAEFGQQGEALSHRWHLDRESGRRSRRTFCELPSATQLSQVYIEPTWDWHSRQAVGFAGRLARAEAFSFAWGPRPQWRCEGPRAAPDGCYQLTAARAGLATLPGGSLSCLPGRGAREARHHILLRQQS
jgi:hypothetical protein